MIGAIESHYFAPEIDAGAVHVVPDGNSYRVAFEYPDGRVDYSLRFATQREAHDFMWEDIRRVNL